MSSHSTTRGIAIAIMLAALSAVESAAVERIGGALLPESPAARTYDATVAVAPVLTAETTGLSQAGALAIVSDGLFVAEGNRVWLFERRAPGLPARAYWDAPTPVLGLADGPRRGQVLVLSGSSLRLVEFPDDGAPTELWSLPLSNEGLDEDYGRLIARDGNLAYVADSSVPGVRVVTIDPLEGPLTVGLYVSIGGPVHDLSLWNRTMTALTSDSVFIVDTGSGETPAFAIRGKYVTRSRPSVAESTSRYAFVGLDSMLIVLDIDRDSPDFLLAPVGRFEAESSIRSVRLDKDRRAYLLEPGSYEILDVNPFGGR